MEWMKKERMVVDWIGDGASKRKKEEGRKNEGSLRVMKPADQS